MPEIAIPTIDDIQAASARIASRLQVSPLVRSADLEATLGYPLWLKLESLQRTGSFKVRGALNWLMTADDAETRNGLVTVSAGNHALALAWAARQARVPVTVVMPEGSSPLKVRLTESMGAEVILHGKVAEAVAHCHDLSDEKDLTLVHPYNDPRVMAGQGTVGLELLTQKPDLQRVICPIGGGGLISGLGIAMKAARPDLELIGVEPEGAATMHNAWQHRDVNAALASVSTWASSLAPAIVGDYTYTASRQVVDRIVTVSEAGIRHATRQLLLEGHVYVEPGASVGLAALNEGRIETRPDCPTALIVTGANMDPEDVGKCLIA